MAVKDLPQLEGAQDAASDPDVHAALSASAGTGKTTVLTARVLRLLLRGVSPASILCLTYTRAAAAEMSNRINQRLASWVRMKESDLRTDLTRLRAPTGEHTIEEARRLFAKLLDTPGGLRIETIHAFSQGLLAAFPSEAGVPPGFEAIDDRAADALAEEVLADLAAEAQGDPLGETVFLADLERLGLRMGAQGAIGYLKQCAATPRAFAALAGRDVHAFVRAEAGLGEGDAETILAEALTTLDTPLFDRLIAGHRDWNTKTAAAVIERLTAFMQAAPAARVSMLKGLASGVVTQEGTICKNRPKTAGYDEDAARFADWYAPLAALPAQIVYLDDLAAALRTGRAFVSAYAHAKRVRGYADFTDLIEWTLGLLSSAEIGAWIRYKLDARIDHVLVDEAQDTNPSQWKIIEKLVEEFFHGNAETENRFRTLFMVGDFKQAIYGFQGSQPQEFIAARNRFRTLAAEAGAIEPAARDFKDLSVAQSFRSVPAVLHVVDQTIHTIGAAAMGLEDDPPPHEAAESNADKAGAVELWPPFSIDDEEEGDETITVGADRDDGEEKWLDVQSRRYAAALADRVHRMIEHDGVAPGDVLILLRSRNRLASLIVARLFARGVRVAGVDRLTLSRPLAVQDLLAAMRFATQPGDDLSLACLLVSPLFGWTQERLQALALGRPATLWKALEADPSDEAVAARRSLEALLAIADFVTPARFLETILSGPLDGRRKLMARLGEDARDPIEELVAAAYAFEKEETVSLDRFLHRIESDPNQIKRETEAAGDRVRVMTVHGAKGLEAPVVILADATADPGMTGRHGSVTLPLGDLGDTVVPRPSLAERGPPLEAALEALEAREREEHWRLLYVGMTRAERRLILAGTMPQGKDEVPADSWHARVGQAMAAMDCDPVDLPGWGGGEGCAYRTGRTAPSVAGPAPDTAPTLLPAWLHRPAPPEARPPRPLRPSAVEGEETLAWPPSDPATRAAQQRGILVHSLLERLPAVPSPDRRDRADRWLQVSGSVSDADDRRALVDAALGVLDDPQHAFLFGPDSLAEAPLSAVLPDGRVVAGIADRLVVAADRVAVVDYKTTARVPEGATDVPLPVQRQMQAYREALSVIFPDRAVEAFLLYTACPRLFALP